VGRDLLRFVGSECSWAGEACGLCRARPLRRQQIPAAAAPAAWARPVKLV